MSSYADEYKDRQQAEFVRQWTTGDEPVLRKCPPEFREQHRYTLARMKAAESRLREIERTVRNLQELFR